MQTPKRRRGAQGCPRSSPSPPLLLLVRAVWFCAALSVAAGSFELTILHTNDVHARVEQTSRDSGKCTGQDCYGGVARRATKIRELRAKHRHVLLLDAGDQYQGTVWFNFFKGREVVKFMNSLRYDAMAGSSLPTAEILEEKLEEQPIEEDMQVKPLQQSFLTEDSLKKLSMTRVVFRSKIKVALHYPQLRHQKKSWKSSRLKKICRLNFCSSPP